MRQNIFHISDKNNPKSENFELNKECFWMICAKISTNSYGVLK